jgi:arsenical pump membrane protein
MATIFILTIAAFSVLLMLIRPRNIPEVYWVGGGAALLVLLHLIPFRLAGHAVAEGLDVYLFLIGMMLLSELAKENGVFDWVSSLSVRAADGSSLRLFGLIYLAGTAVTICLSNDATAVVLTPAVLAAVRHARAKPRPYLFACAMIANAASFVLPISNPANLVVFHSNMPPLGLWLRAFLVPSLLSIAVTFLVLWMLFRNDLQQPIEVHREEVRLTAGGKLVLSGLGLVIVLLLWMSALGRDLGLPTCLAALLVAAVVCAFTRNNPLPMAKQISWATLGLVAALFVLVEAVQRVGVLRLTEAALARAEAWGPQAGALVVAVVVAVANNLVNNLPLGLLAGKTLAAMSGHGPMANAVLIGVDLGPNLSVTGSLATILWLLALQRENLKVGALDFLKIGMIAMPVALLAAMAGALAMQAMFPSP